MHLRLTTVLMLGAAAVAGAQGGRGGGGTQIGPGEECPPGMTEIRPRTCMAPQFPAPSIVDYRPRSTLVTTENKVPKPKFPVIDVHGHAGQRLLSQDALNQFGAEMDELGLQMYLAQDNVSGERLVNVMAAINANPKMKDRVRVFTGIDLDGVGPGWAARAVAQLEADVKAGAVGIGEINKGFGHSIRKADGTRLRLNDPDLDPVFQAAARLNVPVLIHTADPQEFYQPIDNKNERWLELALFSNRRYPPSQFPTFETLMAERDSLFLRNPRTTFILAHFGWHANDLGRLGAMLDRMPNVYPEMGAVLYDIGRQPRRSREFFLKYQDRLLFGKDSYQPIEYPYFWRVLETADDYFDYYRDYHAFWKLYGIELPDSVLKKVYYANALRITPRLPKAGFPR